MTSISKFTAESGVKRIFKIGAFGKVMGIAYGQLFGSQWPVARFFPINFDSACHLSE